jgi:hypothetical protein
MCRLPIKIGETTYYVDMEEFTKLKKWREQKEKEFPNQAENEVNKI